MFQFIFRLKNPNTLSCPWLNYEWIEVFLVLGWDPITNIFLVKLRILLPPAKNYLEEIPIKELI